MFGYAYWNTRNAVQNSYVPVAHTNIRNGCKLIPETTFKRGCNE